MQRTMSARIDESVVVLIDQLAKERKMSKKEIIEEAIKNLWEKIHIEKDIFQLSFGAWERDEPPEETIRKAREAFNRGMQRHHHGL